jgi:putative pyoverdin transport system ATP-binding/permease protein
MKSLAPLLRFLMRFSAEVPHARGRLALVVVAGLGSGAANILLIALLNASLADLGRQPGWRLPAFVALCLVLPAGWFLSQYLVFGLMQETLHELRVQSARRILGTPLRRLEELGAHRLLATLTDDVMQLSNALLDVPLLCTYGAVIVAGLVYLGALSWRLLLVLLVLLALGLASYQLPMLRATRHFTAARRAFDDLVKHLRSLTEGIKELQGHRRRRADFLERLLVPAGDSFRRASVRGALIFAAATGWGRTLFFVALGLLVFGLPAVAPGRREVLTGYVLGLLYLMNPIDVILRLLPELSQAGVALRRVDELGLALAERTDAAVSPPAIGTPAPRIRRHGVSHTYRSEDLGEFTLGPLDLTLTAGRVLFVIGGNGSGKTTLVKLLTGLYAPETGEVLVDGQPVDEASRPAYRELFSTVYSDFFLFEELLGLDAPDLEARASSYLRRLGLEEKVQVKGGGLSTIDLSRGQRKRLALLVAYLEDRPVYVFDEWAADQDPVFREVFYREIVPSLRDRGKSVVVVSHDERYFSLADEILELDYGRAVAPGALHP